MSDIQTHIRAALVRHLVQKTIVCPQTEEVLDVRTCVVILDADDDPRSVLSQAGWKKAEAQLMKLDGFVHGGWHVDTSTVKAEVSIADPAVPLLNKLDADRITAVKVKPITGRGTPAQGLTPTVYKLQLDDGHWRRLYVYNYGNGGGTPFVLLNRVEHYLTPEGQARVEVGV